MSSYCGRFAPSPSGELHFGSLVTAVASYCQAKSKNGRWLLRIEDIDLPRVEKGADQQIIQTLHDFGFVWDGDVRYQSQRLNDYTAALSQLQQQNHSYPCNCGRKAIRHYNETHHLPVGLYPGFCRTKAADVNLAHSWRLKVPDQDISFTDKICGLQIENLAQSCGDFILKRSDQLFSYQLAVVIDDAQDGISEIIRGQDLLESTNRQRYLQQCLDLPESQYAHIPLVLDKQGRKLSKQNHAPALDRQNPLQCLWQALDFLQQTPPNTLQYTDLDTLWHWAWTHWHLPDK